MKPRNDPNSVSELLPYAESICRSLESSNLEKDSNIISGTTADGFVCWLACGSSLEVLSTATRGRLAAWRFGAVLKDMHTCITCIKEYWCNNCLKLLVGTTSGSQSHLLSMFDVHSSRIVKTFEAPYKITSMETITRNGGEDLPKWALNFQICHFYGIIAVGMQGGYVCIVDMCNDDIGDCSDELAPNTLQMINPRTRDMEQQRQKALSKCHQLAMLLDNGSHVRGNFIYKKPDDTKLSSFKSDTTHVSCMKYIPQTGTLAVGFNFGGFQLWKLSVPVLDYSSRLEGDHVPITHFAYQEPENDPKNFCYLWVARGPTVYDTVVESFTTIGLYQLAYNKSTLYSNYGVFYEDLMTVGLRLEHDLSPDPLASTSRAFTSRLLACYTLADTNYIPSARLDESDSFEESSHGPDLSLCLFVWEASAGNSSENTTYHLGLFDMNRWYHTQMPSAVRFLNGEACPYFSFNSLNSAMEAGSTGQLLTVHVGADSVRRFVNNAPLPPEKHFFPSSLRFNAECIFENGIVSANFLGSQRQVLSDLLRSGPVSLLEPHDCYHLCVHAGLIPRLLETSAQTLTLPYQRECLLSMCLDNSMISFISACISDWADGDFTAHNCTLKFLLEWAWNKVAQIKKTVDSTCVSLYDWSGLQLDQRSLRTLHQSEQKLCHLITVFQAMISQSAPTTEQGLADLVTKMDVLMLLLQHLQMVLWFVDSHLLPETDEADELMEGQYSFPAGNITQAYSSMRQDLQKLHSDVGPTDLLMIDGLLDNVASSMKALWDREGGSGLYPPPSLNALLKVYLLDDVPLLHKHCIMCYMLLDLVSLIDTEQHKQFADKIAKFNSVFSIPGRAYRLTLAFWYLDHKEFEESLRVLLQSPSAIDLGSWQHERILKALLYQGQGKLALRYLTLYSQCLSSPNEVKLKLTVLLANGLTSEAFEYQRICRDRGNLQELLHHLFLGCQQTKAMDQLLQLPLSRVEEQELEAFLLGSPEPHSAELLVMYYLQKARYVEAIRLNEKIKHSMLNETSARARDRAAARNSIVDGFSRVLPVVQRKLAFHPLTLPRKSAVSKREVVRPKPLSTRVTKSSQSQLRSNATLILAIMEELKQVVGEEDMDSDSPQAPRPDLGPFICTPATPKRARLSDTHSVVFPTTVTSASKQPLTSTSRAYPLRRTPGLQPLLTPPRAGEVANRRLSQYMTAGALSLLQTPTIEKRKKSFPSAGIQKTPQSILKVRQMISRSPSPALSLSDQALPVPKLPKPKRLGFSEPSQAGTPRSVSFAEVSNLSSCTPKQLRFVEPSPSPSPLVTGRKTIKSPPSPRSVRDRSPTPEKISVKFSPKVDIVSPRLEERTSDQISSSSSEIKEEVEDFDMESDEDQEVTFHTSHVQVQESDEDMDACVDTLPLSSPAVEQSDRLQPDSSPVVDTSDDVQSHSSREILEFSSDTGCEDSFINVISDDDNMPSSESAQPDVSSTSEDVVLRDQDLHHTIKQEPTMELPVYEGRTMTATGSSYYDTMSMKNTTLDISQTRTDFTHTMTSRLPRSSLVMPKLEPEDETADLGEELEEMEATKYDVDDLDNLTLFLPESPEKAPPSLSPRQGLTHPPDLLVECSPFRGPPAPTRILIPPTPPSQTMQNTTGTIKEERDVNTDINTLLTNPMRMQTRSRSISPESSDMTTPSSDMTSPSSSQPQMRSETLHSDFSTLPASSSEASPVKIESVEVHLSDASQGVVDDVKICRTPTRSRNKTELSNDTCATESPPSTPSRRRGRPRASKGESQKEALPRTPTRSGLRGKASADPSPDKSLPRTPTRSNKGTKNIEDVPAESLTPTRSGRRASSRKAKDEGENVDNVPLTPTRSSRRRIKKDTEEIDQPKTPTRLNKSSSMEAEQTDTVSLTPTRSGRIMKTRSSEDETMEAGQQRTPTRSSKKGSKGVEMLATAETAPMTPTRSGRRVRAKQNKDDDADSSRIGGDGTNVSGAVPVTPTRSLRRRVPAKTSEKSTPTRATKGVSSEASDSDASRVSSPIRKDATQLELPAMWGMTTRRRSKELDGIASTDEEVKSNPRTPTRRSNARKSTTSNASPTSKSSGASKQATPTRGSRNVEKAETVTDESDMDHGQTMAVPQSEKELHQVEFNASFTFAEPTQVDATEEKLSPEPTTPVKSFIFSLPLTRAQRRVPGEQSSGNSLLKGTLISQLTTATGAPLVTDDVEYKPKKKKTRSKKTASHNLTSDSPITFVSPFDDKELRPRRVTRNVVSTMTLRKFTKKCKKTVRMW